MSLYLLLHYVLIHCVYTGLISHNPKILDRMDLFTAIVVGIFRIMMFSAKYQCMYGISQSLQALDGFEVRNILKFFQFSYFKPLIYL